MPEGQACAHSNVANDSRTKFPISGKDPLGWLMRSYGFVLGLAMPLIFGMPCVSQVGNHTMPWPCQARACIRCCPRPQYQVPLMATAHWGVQVEFVGTVLARPSFSGISLLLTLPTGGLFSEKCFSTLMTKCFLDSSD